MKENAKVALWEEESWEIFQGVQKEKWRLIERRDFLLRVVAPLCCANDFPFSN